MVLSGTVQKHISPAPVSRLRRQLLRWYDHGHRALPWRFDAGQTADPYHVWLSEIMLQQTQVATVIPYFETFLKRWPSILDLAAAELDDVLHAWAGLGYYARARNLYRCAQVVAHDLGGAFPDDEAGLRALPGVGPYTAAAIAAIAFGRRTGAVDGNVVRVLSRLDAMAGALADVRRQVEARAKELAPLRRPGDFTQALMDLGATVCTAKNPVCGDCPWRRVCLGVASGAPENWPPKARKKKTPTRYGVVFWTERDDGAVLLRRRPERGLLGGMMEFPSTPWAETPWGEPEALTYAPVAGHWRAMDGEVEHVFTHFRLRLRVFKRKTPVKTGVRGEMAHNWARWRMVGDFADLALPTVMKKVARATAGITKV